MTDVDLKCSRCGRPVPTNNAGKYLANWQIPLADGPVVHRVLIRFVALSLEGNSPAQAKPVEYMLCRRCKFTVALLGLCVSCALDSSDDMSDEERDAAMSAIVESLRTLRSHEVEDGV